MVLYRKYRPQTLSSVIGQDHIKEPLLASLKTGKISHAYLFTGPRGTGKTSVARILAKAINCRANKNLGEPCNTCISCQAITDGSYLDLLEIDAASNRGIDEIRDLREKIKLSPALGKYKVYIIDEAHMLTTEAFNALLKTLEEPPEHAVFVLATTEPQKIPATIASRTTRFDFKVPNVAQIKEKLALINRAEKWKLSDASLEEIAKMAAGAFRDAEVLLEKIASFDTAADPAKTREVLGKRETKTTILFLKLIEEGKTKEPLLWLDNYVRGGGSVRILAESVLDALRKILIVKAGAEGILDSLTPEETDALKSIETQLTKTKTLELIDSFNKAIVGLRDATIPQLPIEIAIIESTIGSGTNSPQETPVGIKNTQEVSNTFVDKEIKDGNKPEKPVGPVMKKKSIKENTLLSKKDEGDQTRTLKVLRENWNNILKEVKKINSSLEMFLRDAKPVDLDEDLLTIEFNFRFHKEKVDERKYREVVEDVLKKFVGVPLRLKGFVAPKPQEPKKQVQPEVSEKNEDIDPLSVFGTLD